MNQALFNIITRCSRPENLLRIKESIFNNNYNFLWFIYFDVSILKDISAELLSELQDDKIKIFFKKSISGDYGHQFINDAIDIISDGWIYVLDDDNILHEDFIINISNKISDKFNKRAFIFNQKVGGKDFSELDIREASPENMRVQHIDMAQFLLRRDLIGNKRLEFDNYKADGVFIEDIYKSNPDDFYFISEILCYYNFLKNAPMPISLPRILLIGEDIDLKSEKLSDFEEDNLNKRFILNDENINKEIYEFNPDSIVSIGDSYQNFPKLGMHSLDVRSRWLHFDKKDEKIGELAYQCSNFSILNGYDDNTPLVSLFTPIFNTGEKLIRTYKSIQNQTYNNWEWVIVNDSSDGGKTLKMAESIAENDPRVKVYDFRKKSGGIIGESKYRAAVLCRGKYIMELDHDDCLTNDALFYMVDAYKKFPDSKFVYSDCAEIDENYNSLTYGDGFSFGYGSYYKDVYDGKIFDVAKTSNINPKTIRHIVGVPNHFRSWDREFYMSIGGHNRRLTIADDYELIVRSFLKTRFTRVPKLCYLQFFHNSDSLNNTQNSSRADIQRRVRSISNFYNHKIKNRFNELGFEDWAYNENPNNPILSDSRFGENENFVNYTLSLNNNINSIENFII